MKKILKWTAIGLGILVMLLTVVAVGLMLAGTARINRAQAIDVKSVTIPTDEEALTRGAHLVNVYCRDCHGNDLGGQVMLDDPILGAIYAPKITGIAESHSDADLVMAIRHGMDRNGRHLMIMPSDAYIHFSEDDLGALIAFLKTLSQTGAAQPASDLAPVGRMLVGSGTMEMIFPASAIDHELAFPARPEIGANHAYGEYLAQGCQGCHGAGLVGGKAPDPASPPAPNITATGNVGDWSEEEFLTAFRTGVTPSGQAMNSLYMPWPSYAKFSDDELRALWIYLSSLEQVE